MSGALTLREIARALGGNVAGNQVVAPAPGHSRKDRGLAVKPSGRARDGFVLHCHNGHDWRECRDYVAGKLGLPVFEPGTSPDSAEAIIARIITRARQGEAERADAAEREKRVERARELWAEAVEPRDTVVERYLASRLLDVPADVCGDTIRFHRRFPWRDGEEFRRSPAMICAMQDVRTDELRAVHVTLLSDEGQKLDRKMRGVAAGTAIRLHAPDAPLSRLIAGEGVESSLSARQLGFGTTVWAMGSQPFVAALPVLDGVEHLALLEERDANGASARAVSDCGHRWQRAGRQVSVILPTTGKDLNDSLRGIA